MNNPIIDLPSKGTRSKLRILESDIIDAISCLEANKAVAQSLLRMWQTCNIDIGDICEESSINSVFAENEDNISALIRQLLSLQQKAASSIAEVSSFCDLASGKAIRENGESLERLANIARQENESIVQLTRRAYEDTTAVKLLTVIAMIYLPVSVVLVSFLCYSSTSG